MCADEQVGRSTANQVSDLVVAILAGGAGLRLRSVLADRPKVLAPIGGQPFLQILLDHLAAAGLRRAVICTGYLGHQVERTLGQTHRSLSLSYSLEPQPLGTAGALRHALRLLTSDPVLVLNGDSYVDIDLRRFLLQHLAWGASGSVALTYVSDVARYGRVQMTDSGVITRFDEKVSGPLISPNGGRHGVDCSRVDPPEEVITEEGWVNAGVYLLSQRVLASIPRGRAVSLEYETLPGWIGRGLCGFPVAGRFLDIGTPRSYAEAGTTLQSHHAGSR